jgi:hypothetical protein
LSNSTLGKLSLSNECWYCCFNNWIIYSLYSFYCFLNSVCTYTYFTVLIFFFI